VHYFLSIGSNLNPEKNLVQIITHLLNKTPQILISRVISTSAIGFVSKHDFLNACLYIETDLKPAVLKAYFNHLECELGRDRNDPNRAKKDHPADIDIIWSLEILKDFPTLPPEPYIQPLLLELLAFLGYPIEVPLLITGVSLTVNQQKFGFKPTWIAKELL
jgi:2-amino-4-hydroxy-6-hydroxymethyldihydropteridine diphosphokinase